MMKKLLMACLPLTSLAGCAADQQMPLVFARTQTAGIGIQGSAADQGASLTLGFNDRNLAVVPTTTREGEQIRSIATGKNARPFQDALSVLGQFEIRGGARSPGTVGTALGTFFSTGMASRLLAEGFADRLSGDGGGSDNGDDDADGEDADGDDADGEDADDEDANDENADDEDANGAGESDQGEDDGNQ